MKPTRLPLQNEPPIVVAPPSPARATVIWLHGLGADGRDFVPLVPELDLPAGHAIRFVFPHAPVRPVTINMGMAMRAWYDILGFDASVPQDAAGIGASVAILRQLIAAETGAGIDSRAIVVAGFSQGGAMALHGGLTHPEPLAGVLSLSGYLPLHERFREQATAANRGTPVSLHHGRLDPVVPIGLGTQTRDGLRAMGYTVDWAEYPMQHEVCAEEIEAIGRWLRQRLPAALHPSNH